MRKCQTTQLLSVPVGCAAAAAPRALSDLTPNDIARIVRVRSVLFTYAPPCAQPCARDVSPSSHRKVQPLKPSTVPSSTSVSAETSSSFPT